MLHGLLSYWVFPVIASLCWLGTLLGLLIHWTTIGEPHYASMDANQHIAYISDVGAQDLKPLFIAGSSVTVVTLQIGFFSDRWLRHRGRLARNLTPLEKWLSGISMVFAMIGAAGLILLSIFDTLRHPRLHDVFLLLFIVGYIVSAICLCWEFYRLGKHFREYKFLQKSYFMKLFFIVLETILAIAFIATNWGHSYNAAAVLEWAVAFIFTFYLASFVIDLWPARLTHDHDFDRFAAKRPTSASPAQMEEAQAYRGWRDTIDSQRTLTEPVPAAGVGAAGSRINGYDF